MYLNCPKASQMTIAGLLASCVFASAQAGNLYRWSDADGNVHYSDRLNPEHLQQGYRIISEQGMTIYTIESVTEQMADEIKSPEIQAEAKRQQHRSSRDNALLRTYANEDEINDARERKMSHLESLIEMTEEAMRLLEQRLHELSRLAGDFERKGTRAPETLRADIASIHDKLNNYQQALAEHHDKQLNVLKQFEHDLNRYREITAALPNPGKIRP